MERSWTKTVSGEYLFQQNSVVECSMTMDLTSTKRRAKATIGDLEYHLKRVGFWKKTIEITDKNGIIITKIKPKKWLGTSSVFTYKGTDYQLVSRNNPLAEWVILQEKKEVISYGMHIYEGNVQVKINVHSESTDVLFDCILWYVLAPIAQENSGDDLSFLFLLGGV